MDTSAFLALAAGNDQHFLRATEILETLRTNKYHLLTSRYVIAESHAGILRDVGWETAFRFLQGMAQTNTRILRAKGSDEIRAREIIGLHPDQDYSFCDAISFAVMERLNVRLAFTFDDHFRHQGYYCPLGNSRWPR